jgi:uncharacterized protein (DUF362 family)
MKLTRRQFLAVSALAGIGILSGGYLYTQSLRRDGSEESQGGEDDLVTPYDGDSDIFIVKTTDRSAGVRSLLENYDLSDYSGGTVVLKANFNSAHPFPASTHLDTLGAIVESLKEAGSAGITLGERSGMGDTDDVLEQMGVYELGDRLGFRVVSLDQEDRDGWEKMEADWLHWNNGFYVSKVFLESDKVVQTCCLKTHRFGGHFTMSLKNSVGLIADRVPGDAHSYMRELHGSSHQRRMIAEINKFYDVDIAIMDAIKAFVNRGPEAGDVVNPNLMLASRDRVALDAVGVAILRSHGSTEEVMRGRIFDLDQIKRAAEIGVGVASPEKIRLIPVNDDAAEDVERINEYLKG